VTYLDGNASARLRPEARTALESFLDSGGRNPSSVHRGGQLASKFLRQARREVLEALGLASADLVFTSGGTESCNTMIRAWLPDKDAGARKILSSSIEHLASLNTLELLRSAGWSVDYLDIDKNGRARVPESVDVSELALVTLMAANNETGIVQPLADLAGKLREQGYEGPIVSDFTQMPGKSSVAATDLFEAGVDALALSGHKVGAPAGVGAIVFKSCRTGRCADFKPMLVGGAHESYRRAGTENLLGIVGMGAAFSRMNQEFSSELSRMRKLSKELWKGIKEVAPDWELVGGGLEDDERLANTLLVRTGESRGDDLVVALDLAGVQVSTGALDLAGVQVSTGSACSSGKQNASHVLEAMGFSKPEARQVIRISLDWKTSESDIEEALAAIGKVAQSKTNRVAS